MLYGELGRVPFHIHVHVWRKNNGLILVEIIKHERRFIPKNTIYIHVTRKRMTLKTELLISVGANWAFRNSETHGLCIGFIYYVWIYPIFTHHYGNTPMQYTEFFQVVKTENF